MRDSKISMTRYEQKLVMLQILKKFADFCENNKLSYFIDQENCLGAVRHQGYIPWDDDIDVNMPIDDYDKFVQLTKENHGFLSGHLRVEYPEETIYPFLKISDDRTILVEFPQKYPMEVGDILMCFLKLGLSMINLGQNIFCSDMRLFR